MGPVTIPYDDAAYAVDGALERAVRADTVGIERHVSRAVDMVAQAPYRALVRDARWFGADAVAALDAGDLPLAIDYLRCLRHVVDDMARLDSALLVAA